MFGGRGGLRPLQPLPAPNMVPPLMPLNPLYPLRPLPALPALPPINVVPPLQPLTPLPNLGLGVPTPYYWSSRGFSIGPPGGPSIGFAEYYGSWGVTPWAYWSGWNYPPFGYSAYSGSGSGYMSGGSANDPYAREYARAQRDAAQERRDADLMARPRIAGAREYENRDGTKALPEIKGGTSPEAQEQAINETDPAAIATGEPLNHLLHAVVAADTKNAKLSSLYLRPDVLSQVRFGGSPAADALNLLRAGRPDFPAAFEEPSLAASRDAVEKELAGIAAALKANKAADAAALGRLAAAVKTAQDKLTPVLKDLSFDDAVAARRFLNQLDATVKVLRDPSSAGLVNTKWATDGSSVADLTRYMARYKLLFGPADKGDEEVYTTLHRGLAWYLTALRQNSTPKK
jgi:hypothetical protein